MYNMDKEFVYLAFSTISRMVAVMSILLLVINKRKKDRDIEKETKVELSYMREYIEKKLHDINNKLTDSEEKWKEINHLLLSYTPNVDYNYFKSRPVINNSFFQNFRINPDDIKIQKDLVFLLTPFNNLENDTFDIVKNVCSEMGLRCIRGD